MLLVVQEEAVVNQCLPGVNNPPNTHTFTHTTITIRVSVIHFNSSHEGGKGRAERPATSSHGREAELTEPPFACITTLLCGLSTAGPLLWLQSSIPRQLSQPTNYRIRRSNKAPPTPAPTAKRILACVTVYLSVSTEQSANSCRFWVITWKDNNTIKSNVSFFLYDNYHRNSLALTV